MKRLRALFALFALCTLSAIGAPLTAKAAPPTPLGPNGGHYGNWQAASYGSGAGQICYAFTKPQRSTPNWKSRGLVMLTVTERPGLRDVVSLTPGYDYPKAALVSLGLGQHRVELSVQDDVAFADDGAAVIAAFAKLDSATSISSAPASISSAPASVSPGIHRGKKLVLDEFSLTGFAAAYQAITSQCP